VGKTIRLTVSPSPAPFHEFSLRLQQGDVRAAYVPLARLQRDLNQPGKINTILAEPRASASGHSLALLLKQRYTLADVGLRTRTLEKPACLSLESDAALIADTVAAAAFSAAQSLGLRAEPLLTYLVNAIRVRGREVPYSVVTALDSALAPAADDGITLNDWTARELAARVGDSVTLEYYVWRSDARLHTETAQFRVERIVPLAGDAADPDLAPEYPGITQSRSFRDWDPPFPLDMTRIRPSDEQYWNRYRTAPKAFVRLARGRRLWGTRFGSLTSIRIFPPSPAFAEALRTALDPAQAGLAVVPVRAESLKAAQGATDFGEYFVYFSFFLMVSACCSRWGSRQRESGLCSCSKARCWRSLAQWPAWELRWHTARSSCWGSAPGGSTPWGPACFPCTPRFPRWPWEPLPASSRVSVPWRGHCAACAPSRLGVCLPARRRPGPRGGDGSPRPPPWWPPPFPSHSARQPDSSARGRCCWLPLCYSNRPGCTRASPRLSAASSRSACAGFATTPAAASCASP
jgi:hypothetical protein